MSYYPVYLDLRGRRTVVLGGGALAEEKARGLLAAGARVILVAAEATAGIAGLAAAGALAWERRAYRPGDLAGACLAIAAGLAAADAETVSLEARRRGIFLNSVDDVPHSSFIAAAVVRRGDLTVAISTGGKAPALAVRLRERLERELGPEHARFLELAGTVRAPLAERHPDFARRRELWYRLVDSDVLDLLRQGDEPAARRRFAEILGVEAPGSAAPAVVVEPAFEAAGGPPFERAIEGTAP
jgi:siroheme synthase-like protein